MQTPSNSLLAAGASLLLLASAPASAQVTEAAAAGPNLGRVSLDLGVDWTSAYYWRGYLQEDSGFIAQPWVEVGFSLREAATDDDFSISAHVGNWNSFHSEKTGSNGTGSRSWYESDFYGGVTFGWRWLELGVGYIFYTYPNNSDSNTVQELGLTAGIDLPDEEWTGRFIGDLSFGLHIETDNSNVNDDEAVYFEFGFGPSFDLFDGKATLSVPVSLGFSVDDFYRDAGGSDDTLGFGSIGAHIEVPLCDGDLGAWTLTGGVTVLFLGNAAEEANDDDDVDAYGFIGLSMSY